MGRHKHASSAGVHAWLRGTLHQCQLHQGNSQHCQWAEVGTHLQWFWFFWLLLPKQHGIDTESDGWSKANQLKFLENPEGKLEMAFQKEDGITSWNKNCCMIGSAKHHVEGFHFVLIALDALLLALRHWLVSFFPLIDLTVCCSASAQKFPFWQFTTFFKLVWLLLSSLFKIAICFIDKIMSKSFQLMLHCSDEHFQERIIAWLQQQLLSAESLHGTVIGAPENDAISCCQRPSESLFFIFNWKQSSLGVMLFELAVFWLRWAKFLFHVKLEAWPLGFKCLATPKQPFLWKMMPLPTKGEEIVHISCKERVIAEAWQGRKREGFWFPAGLEFDNKTAIPTNKTGPLVLPFYHISSRINFSTKVFIVLSGQSCEIVRIRSKTSSRSFYHNRNRKINPLGSIKIGERSTIGKHILRSTR